MKRILILLFVLPLLLPFFSLAQFMKDYRPTGSPLVTSTVNLVSVVEATAGASQFSRSINTIQESATVATNDVWVNNVDSLGNVLFSRRYGLQNVDEVSSALIRCPNGDFIYAATTSFGGFRSAWLFRRGIINWSNRYLGGNVNVRSLCIKKTNEVAENYIVAGTYNNDSSLLVFKITAGGIMTWNRRYTDPLPPANLTDVPKSMVINRDTVIIAGNRTFNNAAGAVVRDLFVIGVLQTNGAITHPYSVIDNSTRDDIDPFINFGFNNEFVLTYQTIVAIAGINTGRISFTRLNASLGLASPITRLLWETNATGSFGHTIYQGATGAAPSYDIGGGTKFGNFNNPLFVSVSNTGVPLAGTYRRLWTNLDFNSTFMLRDAFVATNRYEHHNWKRQPNLNSMSLLRGPNTFAAPCNVFPQINNTSISVSLTLRTYLNASVLTQTTYTIPDTIVHGTILLCNGGGGVFKTGGAVAEEEAPAAEGSIKTYPTPLRSGEPLRIQVNTSSSEPVSVSIYNAQAVMVYNAQETASKGNLLSVNTSGFKPGMYIVEVKQGTAAWRNKIIVE